MVLIKRRKSLSTSVGKVHKGSSQKSIYCISSSLKAIPYLVFLEQNSGIIVQWTASSLSSDPFNMRMPRREEDWGKKKRVSEDEMARRHHWCNGHAAAAKSLQLCPTLCDPIDGSPPGSPIPGILQARTLEWVAISFSNARKWKVKRKSLSHIRLLETPWTAAYQAPQSMGFSRQEYWSGVPLPSLAMNTNLGKLQEKVRCREAWRAAVHGVCKGSDTTGWLNNREKALSHPHMLHYSQRCSSSDVLLVGLDFACLNSTSLFMRMNSCPWHFLPEAQRCIGSKVAGLPGPLHCSPISLSTEAFSSGSTNSDAANKEVVTSLVVHTCSQDLKGGYLKEGYKAFLTIFLFMDAPAGHACLNTVSSFA